MAASKTSQKFVHFDKYLLNFFKDGFGSLTLCPSILDRAVSVRGWSPSATAFSCEK